MVSSAATRINAQAGFVRMSWAPANLYNLARLSGPDPPAHLGSKLNFKRTSLTLFQQRWASKRLLRAYHGDWIQERVFRRRFLPNGLPALEARNSKGKQPEIQGDSAKIPLASLMWREVEARLDVLVFRACFAHSVYEARRLVTQGHVKLNGKVVSSAAFPLSEAMAEQPLQMTQPGVLLEPGDIFSVDPKEMYLLRQHDHPFEKQALKSAEAETTEEAEVESSTSGEAEAAEEGLPAGEEVSTEATAESSSSSEALTSSAADTPAPSSPAKKKVRTPLSLPGQPFTLPDYAAPFIFIPAYLEVSFSTCSGIYVRHPTARPGYSEIPSPFDADGEVMRFGWEFYKGVGRRRRGTEDWGDRASHDPKGRMDRKGAKYDEKGRRIWASEWEELKDAKRVMRGVREGRGRWANRPL